MALVWRPREFFFYDDARTLDFRWQQRVALVWKPREFFRYGGARPIEFVAGWRNEKLEWPGPPNIGEQLRIIRVRVELGARPIEFAAGRRNEKLEWPGSPNIGEQLWIIRLLAERGAKMGVKSQGNGSRSKFRATFVKNDGVGDFYQSRAFEYRPH